MTIMMCLCVHLPLSPSLSLFFLALTQLHSSLALHLTPHHHACQSMIVCGHTHVGHIEDEQEEEEEEEEDAMVSYFECALGGPPR